VVESGRFRLRALLTVAHPFFCMRPIAFRASPDRVHTPLGVPRRVGFGESRPTVALPSVIYDSYAASFLGNANINNKLLFPHTDTFCSFWRVSSRKLYITLHPAARCRLLTRIHDTTSVQEISVTVAAIRPSRHTENLFSNLAHRVYFVL
jgi:hypothetical protein